MLTQIQQKQKRIFDIILSIAGILLTWWIVLLAWIAASFETRSNGLFVQTRIGRHAKPFAIFKIKTMYHVQHTDTHVTTSKDTRITKSGAFFRKMKIDELPQLWNVLIGDMSFVGPRPDVPGFADKLEGEERKILELRPGITGPASLKYRSEETILSQAKDPERYNREIIWPDKVKINRVYMEHWSLSRDIMYIIKTIIG
ncbi:MAG TPA: sugar transferase [Sulfurovum sp. UBA12169]|jgi:Sugar transferases involved in lipopolysaccharide synthesis|nr:MAG TPA: sugar transferase [Sulfurovum sp. UBA12169]